MYRVLSLFFLLALGSKMFAQDTLRLSLAEVDQSFLQHNLNLLAAKANIDLAQAQTRQARLWDNPSLNFETGLINGAQHQVLDGKQQYVQLQQLFQLAGKRRKLVDIQLSNEKLSAAQFYELTRALKHQLHSDYYDLAALYQKMAWYQTQINQMTALADTLDRQVRLGNFAEKDAVRVRAEALRLDRERNDLALEVSALNTELQTLLMPTRPSVIVPTTLPATTPEARKADELVQLALNTRPDMQTAQFGIDVAEKNLRYQKALASTDLTVGLDYDRASTYTTNYVGLQLGVIIPSFNRNQGNIHAAAIGIDQQKRLRDGVQQQIQAEVNGALQRVRTIENWRQSKPAQFYKTYEDFYANVLQSYQRKQVTLPEFMDYFQTLQSNKLQQVEQDNQLRQAYEDLQWSIGQ